MLGEYWQTGEEEKEMKNSDPPENAGRAKHIEADGKELKNENHEHQIRVGFPSGRHPGDG